MKSVCGCQAAPKGGKERPGADNKTEQLVVAYFDSKDQAEQAAGALAVVSKNDKGKVETTKLGPRNTGKGAKIGTIAGGILGGGAGGALHRSGQRGVCAGEAHGGSARNR